MITMIFNDMVWYEYKGDEIAWTGSTYYSLLSGGYFMTLQEMDEFWKQFEKDYNNLELSEV